MTRKECCARRAAPSIWALMSSSLALDLRGPTRRPTSTQSCTRFSVIPVRFEVSREARISIDDPKKEGRDPSLALGISEQATGLQNTLNNAFALAIPYVK